MYVSDEELLKTSGLAMTYRMFLDSLIVTLEIPSTGFNPKINRIQKFLVYKGVTRISEYIKEIP